MNREKSQFSDSDTIHWRRKGREDILNVRSETIARRTRLLSVIDKIGSALSKPGFFLILLLSHLTWIFLNLPFSPGKPWDPYPFIFLATLASVEAPFIAILILMHQQRNTRIDELRGEIELQVSLHIERQTSMTLRILRELQKGLQVPTEQDKELLERMEAFLDPLELMQFVRDQLKEIEGVDPAKTL
jgi:uncharacterized membrane protein